MKTLIQLTITLLYFAAPAFGQVTEGNNRHVDQYWQVVNKVERLDSVHIQLTPGIVLKLAAHQQFSLQFIEGLDSIIHALNGQREAIATEVKYPNSPVTLFVSGGVLMVDNPKISKQVYTLKDGGEGLTRIKPFGDRIVIQYPRGLLAIIDLKSLEDLSTLDLLDLDKIIEAYKVEMNNQKLFRNKDRRHRITYALTQDGQSRVLIDESLPSDVIELSGGGNLALIRDRLVPDIGVEVAIGLGDKRGDLKHRFTARLDLHYFFNQEGESGKYNMDINYFLNAGYTNYHEVGPNRTRYHASIGAGYLISRNGDFFEGETGKVWVNFGKAESRFRIGTELYATDDFKVWFPSVRLGFNL